ncbi:MAG TPA: hypothetical protein DD434_13670 [Bacteroidales bacterium]|nr:hypothetical protein [Bacteroidales bacterium]
MVNNIYITFSQYAEEPTSLKDFNLKGKVKSFTRECFQKNPMNNKDTILYSIDKYKFNPSGFITFIETKYIDKSINDKYNFTYDKEDRLINLKYQRKDSEIIENDYYYQSNKCNKIVVLCGKAMFRYQTYDYDTIQNTLLINNYDSKDSLYSSNKLVYDKNNRLIIADGEKIAKYRYDKNNNLIYMKEFDNIYKWKYDKENRLIKESTYYNSKLYREMTFYYDSVRNVYKTSKIVNPNYYGRIVDVKEKTIFDDKGKIKEIKRHYNNQVSKNRFKYNDYGLLIEETYKSKDDKDCYKFEYTYDSNHALIEKRKFEKDIYNRNWIKSKKLKLSKTEKYFFDEKNRNNVIITYSSDNSIYSKDSIFYINDSLKGIHNTYTYDLFLSPFYLSKSDTFKYDNKNRLISHSYWDLNERKVKDFTYNASDSIIYIREKRLNNRDSISTIRFMKRTYNSEGLLVEEENTIDYIFKIFSYDEKGRLKVITDKNDNNDIQIFYYSKKGKVVEKYYFPDGKYNWKENPIVVFYNYDKFGNRINDGYRDCKCRYEYYE